MSTLNQEYDETVRPCIDLIDKLRSLGVEQDLALPAIAVIGDQSSGKSSVLEALSGVALPRGSGIVTRCPLELKMKRTKEGVKWKGRIKYGNYTEDISKPAEVEGKIRQAQELLAGKGCGISHDLISLDIASPDVPDLTLIDLPGIARVAVKGQPENIGEQIKSLISKFITKQETISLVVVPCNVDIATTEALKMAQEVDPEKQRTLGILTKPDLVDKGTERDVVKIVQNKVIPLKKGYMIVKCRGQKDIMENMSLNKAIKIEEAFFRDHQIFNSLYYDGCATVPKLAKKLTLELVEHIKRSLPQLEEQIKKKLIQTNTELEKYGDGPPSEPADRLCFLIDKVTAFTHKAISLTSGEELNIEKNIYSSLRKEFGLWKDIIESSGTSFNCKLEREVAQYDRMYRGRELPGFINYKMFERMVKDQIKLLQEPALTKLRQVAEIVKKEMIKLSMNSFVGFPNLMKTAKLKIETIFKDKEAVAESMLRTQFKMEQLVYTQDSTYSKKLGKRKRTENVDVQGFGLLLAKSNTNNNDNTASLKEMMTHLKSYYKIAGQRLADQIPLVIKFQMLQESSAELQRQMLQLLQDKEEIEVLLKEDGSIRDNRDKLHSCLQRLNDARILLSEF
ncbi:interferon-induced GTP-binding protein Mx-like [Boleophthalmus pectinirostris]|uniref:interferon-induced GTP-binding protein Mx-like n=1 Tax=Boleophthalmus pectinirostris TaxID=150288 RepID=UPI002431CF39|nr:interferon-induced GTP-binding protein Mx-like [Boleophthalmus pectinirostris]